MRLFDRLLSLLFPPRDTERLVRGAKEGALTARCSPASFPFGGFTTVGLLPYLDPLVRAFIIEAKYHGSAMAQEALGDTLATYVREHASAFGTRLALVPIPLGNRRHAERGYNQVECICAAALHTLPDTAIVRADVLARIRETLPQTTLSREERAANVAEAFVAAQDLDPSYSYIVVDDVITTGATLSAAVAALQNAGATQVSAVALAR